MFKKERKKQTNKQTNKEFDVLFYGIDSLLKKTVRFAVVSEGNDDSLIWIRKNL